MRITRAARFVRGAVVVVCLGAAVAAGAQETLDAATAAHGWTRRCRPCWRGVERPALRSPSCRVAPSPTPRPTAAARVGPPAVAATPSMRYSIGSISKQFTAGALLLLAEEGKLSLDDRVVEVVAGADARRRHHHPPAALDDLRLSGLLAAGLRDAGHARATDRRRASSSGWAQKPLDFEPGTQWQYSNTNYVIAGPDRRARRRACRCWTFCAKRVFTPLADDERRRHRSRRRSAPAIRCATGASRSVRCARRRRRGRAGCSPPASWR